MGLVPGSWTYDCSLLSGSQGNLVLNTRFPLKLLPCHSTLRHREWQEGPLLHWWGLLHQKCELSSGCAVCWFFGWDCSLLSLRWHFRASSSSGSVWKQCGSCVLLPLDLAGTFPLYLYLPLVLSLCDFSVFPPFLLGIESKFSLLDSSSGCHKEAVSVCHFTLEA